jgi:hypothetical protein
LRFQLKVRSAALFSLVAVVALAPLLTTAIPPLHDYPFHLARLDALAALTAHVPQATHYQIGNFLLPNVAMDVVALGLTSFMSAVLAGRVFLCVILLMLLGGTVALHRVIHARSSPWPLLAAFFLYNWIFLYGFINYLFGVAVMLWSVAAWLALGRARMLPRLLVGTVLAVVTLFCHLVAFGLLAVILGGLALSETITHWRQTRRVAWRNLLLPAVPVGLTLGLFILLSPTAGEAHQPFDYVHWIGWKPLIAYRTLLWSIPWLNAVTLGPLGILIGLAAWRGRVVVAGAMVLPIALLCLTFAAMPNALFGALYVDVRLPIALLLVVIASLDLRGLSRPVVFTGTALAVGLLVVHSGVIASEWQASARTLAEFEAAFDGLPAGSTLYVATAEPYPKLAYNSELELSRWHPPLKHVASLASIGRDVFVPSTWANPFQQPITVLPEHLAAKQLQGDNPFITPTAESLSQVAAKVRSIHADSKPSLDFLLVLRPTALEGSVPIDLLPTATGDDFVLFRID